MSVTSIRLQPEVEKDLEVIAGQMQRSRNWLVNQAIREYVARHDLQRLHWQQTLAAMSAAARGEVVSAQAVHAWLASWGTAAELPPPVAGQ